MEKNKEKNAAVDVLRGIAMLLVIMGHTMTGCTTDSENSVLFNIIWSLQMPLFFLISGYVTRYSVPISDAKGLMMYLSKKTWGYLFPWAIWTFAVRGLLLGENLYLDVGWLVYHMDSGYWFLFSLYTIAVIYGVACFAGEKAAKPMGKTALNAAVYLSGMIALVCIAALAGLSFCGIKLTLYYMTFYYAGALYGRYQNEIFALRCTEKIMKVGSALLMIVYVALVVRFDLYRMPDDIVGIFMRGLTSATGCGFLCFAISKAKWGGKRYIPRYSVLDSTHLRYI